MSSEGSYIFYYTGIVILTFFSAFFSGIETAIVSSRKISIETLKSKGARGADRAIRILADMESAIGMVLIGNNIVNIGATAFITFVATQAFLYDDSGLFVVTIIQTIFFLFFCEIIPKVFAKASAEYMLMYLSIPIIILLKIFRPMIWLSLLFNNFIKRQIKLDEKNIVPVKSRDDISTFFLIGKNEGVIDDDKHGYVADILSFKYIQAEEVMTPLVDIVSIEKKSSVKDLIELIEKTKFSRIPVYEDSRDNITGYVHYRDLIRNRKLNSLDDIILKPVFIPATKNIFELYNEMFKNKTPFVFVVSEYGDIIGLLTFEDIAEEIVGEIHTDDHPDEDLILQISERKFLVNGRIDIEYFQEYFSINIDKKNFETLGGFLNYLAGRIPDAGDKLKYNDIEFLIETIGIRCIERVTVVLPPKKRKKNDDDGD